MDLEVNSHTCCYLAFSVFFAGETMNCILQGICVKYCWWFLLQRITEIAGVVLSLDPKPIEVRIPLTCSNLALLTFILVSASKQFDSWTLLLMLFIFLVIQNRVIGMVPVATQTTGNILVFELSDNMSS